MGGGGRGRDHHGALSQQFLIARALQRNGDGDRGKFGWGVVG